MAQVTFQARVFYMAQGGIGERSAGGILVKILSLPLNGKSKTLWKGITDHEGRVDVSYENQIAARGLDPALARMLDRQRARSGLVAEFSQGDNRVRLPIAHGTDMQRFVLPWAPEQGMSVQMRKVEKVNPELKKLSKSDLEALLKNTGARIETAVPTKKAEKQKREAAASDLKLFAERFPKHESLLNAIRLADKEPDSASRIKLKETGKLVELLHPRSMMRDMLLMEAEMRDVSFQRRHQKQLYEIAAGGLKQMTGASQKKAAVAFGKLTNPAALADATIEVVQEAVVAVATFIVDFLDWVGGLFGRPATCGGERGTGFGGDATPPDVTVQPNADGLLANNDWPLKHYTTCIRDQGARGTCTAFGIVAAAECLIASDFGIWTNLSEQDLYMHQKQKWFPFPLDWYGDGYNAVYSTILQSLGRTYVFPYERDWDYNQSLSRTEDDDTRTYTMSCVGYNGEACSDTNHQAERTCYSVDLTTFEEVTSEVCTWVESAVSNIPVIGGFLSDVIGEWVCDTVTELVEVVEQIEVCLYDTDTPPSSGFQILNATPVWVPLPFSSPDWTVIKALLTARRPIVFCFQVSESFDGQSGGYVAFNGAGEDSRGGHCALITGFVNNADLPSGAPDGAGGGYFVVKNSWGAGWADQGYCYVPYDWAAEYGTAMIAVNAVSP